ncbi:hypothetical protein AY599_16440 [Leptolyngbya valderiana BDU 20041]|nr:hypothetical protein AY599_16440 [Leptolyngbya valderiana BDU 20041]
MRAQRRPQGVQVGHAAVVVHQGDAGPLEVFPPCQVRHRLRKHTRRANGRTFGQAPAQGVGQLRVHRQHVYPLGLPLTDRQRGIVEVHVSPRQPLQVALAQPG